jgi:hypothetical protein
MHPLFIPIIIQYLFFNTSVNLYNGELDRIIVLFLVTGVTTTTVGENCGLVGKFVPFRVVEGI